jgi:hypothetical protein
MRIYPRNEYRLRFIPNDLQNCMKGFVKNQGLVRGTVFSIFVENDKLHPENNGKVFAHPFGRETCDFILQNDAEKFVESLNGENVFSFKTKVIKTDRGELWKIIKKSRRWEKCNNFEMSDELYEKSCECMRNWEK